MFLLCISWIEWKKRGESGDNGGWEVAKKVCTKREKELRVNIHINKECVYKKRERVNYCPHQFIIWEISGINTSFQSTITLLWKVFLPVFFEVFISFRRFLVVLSTWVEQSRDKKTIRKAHRQIILFREFTAYWSSLQGTFLFAFYEFYLGHTLVKVDSVFCTVWVFFFLYYW